MKVVTLVTLLTCTMTTSLHELLKLRQATSCRAGRTVQELAKQTKEARRGDSGPERKTQTLL